MNLDSFLPMVILNNILKAWIFLPSKDNTHQVVARKLRKPINRIPKVICIRVNTVLQLTRAKRDWGPLICQIRSNKHTTRSNPSWPKEKIIHLYKRNLNFVTNSTRILHRFSKKFNKVEGIEINWQKFNFQGITLSNFYHYNLQNLDQSQNYTKTLLRKHNWD